MSLSRRDYLNALAAGIAASAAGLPFRSPLAASHDDPLIIDPHVHVFNAKVC